MGRLRRLVKHWVTAWRLWRQGVPTPLEVLEAQHGWRRNNDK